QVQDGIQSDMVVTTEQTESEIENDDMAIEETEKGFFAMNWLWIGALAGGGIALAASSSDDPIPVPTLSLTDSEVGGPDASLTVTGTADNNATVAVTIGSITKNVTSSAEGTYSVVFNATDLANAGQGTLSVSVTSNINNGRISETATASLFTDTLAPTAPTISDITADNVINASEQSTIITGTAEAGSSITLTIADNIKTIVVAEDGTWSYALTASDIDAVGQGEEILSLTATDTFGNISDATTLTINVDTVLPNTPTISDVTTDNVVNSAELTTVITGTAEAGAQVALSLGGSTKTISADANGTWTYSLTAADVTAMGEGAETLSATATDAAGNVSAAITKDISVDTIAPAMPTIADVTTDNVINGAEQTAAITGTAEANAQLTITVAGTTKTVTADANGTWTYSLTAADVTAMGEGTETLSATATDAAGNVSAAITKDISVDTIAPDVQTIAADSASQTITLTYNDVLDATNLPAATSFVITTANVSNAVASVAVSGNQVVLTMTDAFSDGIAVTVNYTDASGDEANAIQDLVGNDAQSFATGVVADGYIRGAKIYLDANGNGLADADELLAGVTTDALGNFVLSANDNPNNYSIIAAGGVNVDTGLVNTTPLKAPAGSSVINPLTTLIQTAVESGAANSVAEAKTFINLALGIAPDIDLTTFDPISSLNDGDATAATALVIQKAATQVIALVQLASQGKSEADALSDSQNIFKNIVTNAQATVAENPGQAIDIADETVITSIMDGVDVAVSIASIASASQTLQAAISLAEVSVAQAQTLDNIAPDAPNAIEIIALTQDTTPAVKVSFDTQDLTGKAAVAGDTVTLTATGTASTILSTATLSGADIAQGFVEFNSQILSDDTYTITAQISDKGDNTSTALTAENTIKIDTTAPNVALVSNQEVVNQTETATITLTFTEDPADSIAIGDLTATGGTLSDFTGTGLTRTVTFTPNADVEQSGSVSVTAGSYLDAISNAGTAGTVEFSIDTKAPNVTISTNDTALQSGETATITFTFSEAPGDSFSASDITVTGGTLSGLSGEGALQTATFTPALNSEVAASVTITADAYTDAAGNKGAAGVTPSVSIDTKAAAITTETLSAAENSTVVGSIATSEEATVVLGTGDDSALFT
ncbi:MAG: Ig-like domain-containing protein, partial [Glaciecola sp.]|nr:Ig-like domain-containing protein [Glaciecola sp.]